MEPRVLPCGVALAVAFPAGACSPGTCLSEEKGLGLVTGLQIRRSSGLPPGHPHRQTPAAFFHHFFFAKTSSIFPTLISGTFPVGFPK